MDTTLMTHAGATKVTRQELSLVPTPPATDTFKPIAHAALINELEQSLAFRHIQITRDEYAVSPDGMKLFGLLELNAEFEGVRFAIGLRNANDKSMRLGMVAGYRVFVCDNMALSGDFKPLLAKHTKHFDLVESLSLGVDRIQRGFQPLRDAIVFKRGHQLRDEGLTTDNNLWLNLTHRGLVEIERSIKNPEAATEHFHQVVIQYFHAPVGAVQTAPHSTADIRQIPFAVQGK
jgi:hypothetical protein